jgi:MFS family permease
MSFLEAGMVASGQFLGMTATVPLGGYLADRFGKKPFLIASSMLFVVGLAGYAMADSFAALLLTCVVTGIGSGGYEVGVNALQADQAEIESGRAMNLLHFFYGVGAVAGPFLATWVVWSGSSWRLAIAASAALPLLVSVTLLLQHVAGGRRAFARDPSAIYRDGSLWVLGLALAVYVGIETSIYGWIATFWQMRSEGRLLPSPLVASVFWATLTAGRLLCGKLADRIGLLRFVGYASAATLAASAAWTLWPGPAVTLGSVFLLGLFLAGIFPTTLAFVTEMFPGHAGKVVGFLSVFASLGGFLVPSAVGRLADAWGVGVLPPSVAALSLVLFACVKLVLSRLLRRPPADGPRLRPDDG